MNNTHETSNHADVFIRNDQFNFIKDQTRILINSHAMTNDRDVLNVLGYLSLDKVLKLFPEAGKERKWLLQSLVQVKDEASAEAYLAHLIPFVKPFPSVTRQQVKGLFPKAKKLKGPDLEKVEFKGISYLSWTEGANQKYLITQQGEELTGIQGIIAPSVKMGICHICNRHGEVGLFTAKVKASAQDAYIKRGNYICRDAHVCNSKVDSLDRLNRFVERLEK